MPKNEHYLRRVVPQHKKPKFMSWLEANLQPFFDSETLLKTFDAEFDISKARGIQLDVTGAIVGRDRILSFDPSDGSSPVLDDETYRLLQKVKISLNQWDGTIPSAISLLQNMLPDYKFAIQDNQDMTMNLYVVGLITPLERELITRGYISPKPMGVWINFTFVLEYENLLSNLYAKGARQGSLIVRNIPLSTN